MSKIRPVKFVLIICATLKYMITLLDSSDLKKLVVKQIDNLFTISENEKSIIHASLSDVLEILEHCFTGIDNKYYKKDGAPYFNPFHSGQYYIFLYYLSNYVWQKYGNNERCLSDKLYYLNKALNGLDLYYEVKMPKRVKI